MNNKPPWRFRMSLRESIVAIVVGVLAIALFLGVIRVMSPDSPSPGADAAPAAEPTADLDQYEDAAEPPP